jgi:SPP1 family predicted phage head-tail adaptor
MTLTLTTADLVTFRAAQLASMTTACTIRTPGALTPDGRGGQTQGWTTTTTVCRIAATAGEEREIAAMLQATRTSTLVLPYATVITEACEVVVDGATYRPIAVLPGLTAVRVIAVRAA